MIVTHDDSGVEIYENDEVYIDFYDYNVIAKSIICKIIYNRNRMCFMFYNEEDGYLKTRQDISDDLMGLTFSLFKHKSNRDRYITNIVGDKNEN